VWEKNVQFISQTIEGFTPFVVTRLCDTGFSAVACVYGSRFIIEEIRVSISPMIPRFNELCAEYQAYPAQ